MPDFGPFSVDPAQVAALGGANFGQFVGRLLASEAAAHGMVGTTLETTYLENVGDGGVDAGLRHAAGTSWLPAGDSAWQFKAGNLSPGKCKTELLGASKAIEILRAGGSYRLVLGASLTSAKIADRRAKLLEAAQELGIDASSRIEVLAADSLARWTEEFPALAVSPLLRNTGVIGQTFEEWSRSIRHTTLWVSSPERDAQIATLRSAILGGTQLDIHLDGVSGLGKTRLVLEALRGESCEPIVLYSAAADSFPVTALTQLQSQRRSAVVVIDECDRKQHEIYAQVLTTGTSIRLVTVGEPGGNSTRTPMISLVGFGDEAMGKMLQANRPSLTPEAQRVVVQIAAGNIDYALKLAQLAIEGISSSAGKLVTEDDLRAFFTEQLPDGPLFLASCALAMFSRFGFDGETSAEIELIADGLGLPANDLRDAAKELQRRGLLSKQGRYRSVGPHPVAIYLAAKGWEEYGQRIVAELLPTLDPDLTERLFKRAADVGEFDAASPAIATVLDSGGALASLESIAEGKNSELLVHYAVLAPAAVADRLEDLVASASEEELRQASGIRRDLVWTLEKLAWHSRTFEQAADALLRLAVAENESYSNNASGTWVELFGAMLPGTAASPEARVAYLRASSESSDARVRALVVGAAKRALDSYETIMVSAEVQGGIVVEPRGTPATLGDVWAYRNSAIDLLAALTADDEEAIASDAAKALTDSLHGLLLTQANREHLGRVIAGLSAAVIAEARMQIADLRSLFDKTDTQDARPTALAEFESALPQESPAERLRVLANTRAWDRDTETVANDLVETARQADTGDPAGALIHLLSATRELPGAYAIGRALRLLDLDYDEGVAKLSPFAGTPNGETLIGFLHALSNEGEVDAFDRFLDETDLPAITVLQYSVRGARTAAAATRVDRLVEQVTVAQAARVLFVWMHEADQADSARYLREWESRISSQADYNAAVDFAAMQVFRKPEPLADIDPAIADLVARRRDYPAVGQESWDWSMLVRRQLEANPLGVVKLMADLVEADALSAFSGSEEAKLLQEAVGLAGDEAWFELMDRLESGEWRLSFTSQEWLGTAASVGTAKQWVGESVERARVLANVTTPGGSPLAPIARFLLEKFGHDDRVQSYLVGQFISGMWTGNESERIAAQIAEVQGWIAEVGQAPAVKAWGRKLVANLEGRLKGVVQEEEERGW